MAKQKEIDDLSKMLANANEMHEKQINKLNTELRERLTPAEMTRIKSILVTLQVFVVGLVEYSKLEFL